MGPRATLAFPARVSLRIRAASRIYKQLRRRLVQQPLRRWPVLGPRLIRSWHLRRFQMVMGQPARLAPPAGFNDHIMVRILEDRDPRLKVVCDKIAVRDIIRERAGDAFLVPLLGIWSDPGAIAWEQLPERFVLKPSHASGYVAIVKDESDRDIPALTALARAWLKQDYFDQSLEWGYRGIPRRILAEPLLLGSDRQAPAEAQVFTFGGRSALIRVLTGTKETEDRRDNWFDASGARLPIHSLKITPGDFELPPEVAREIVPVAERAAAGFAHLRVDFYLSDRGPLIGELTPYHGAGLNPWNSPTIDGYLGEIWRDPDRVACREALHHAARAA